jgi:hypothetical protein
LSLANALANAQANASAPFNPVGEHCVSYKKGVQLCDLAAIAKAAMIFEGARTTLLTSVQALAACGHELSGARVDGPRAGGCMHAGVLARW